MPCPCSLPTPPGAARFGLLLGVLLMLSCAARAQQPEQATQQATLAQAPDTLRRSFRITCTIPLPGPLYVLDGSAVTAAEAQQLAPARIRKVKVLRGARAEALYGNQAKHGVIFITSRKMWRPDPPLD